jgi:hypothetical protein
MECLTSCFSRGAVKFLELFHGIKVKTSANNEHFSSHMNLLLHVMYVVGKNIRVDLVVMVCMCL